MHIKQKSIKNYLPGACVLAFYQGNKTVIQHSLQIWLSDRATVVQIWPFLVILYDGGSIRGPNWQGMLNSFSILSDNAETWASSRQLFTKTTPPPRDKDK